LKRTARTRPDPKDLSKREALSPARVEGHQSPPEVLIPTEDIAAGVLAEHLEEARIRLIPTIQDFNDLVSLVAESKCLRILFSSIPGVGFDLYLKRTAVHQEPPSVGRSQ